MIVPSMNHRELMKEINIDIIGVENKAFFLAEGLRRTVYKTKTKPLDRWFDYQSPRRNNWLLLIRHYGKHHYLNSFVWYLGEHGANIVCMLPEPGGIKATYHHFTSHFMKRYNERFLHRPELSVIEAAKLYFVRNMEFFGQTKQQGGYEAEFMGVIQDGVFFGEVKYEGFDLYVTYKTFISKEMVLEFQKNDIRMIDEFKNGKVFNIEDKKCLASLIKRYEKN